MPRYHFRCSVQIKINNNFTYVAIIKELTVKLLHKKFEVYKTFFVCPLLIFF